jgi:hypothetical protein
MAPTRPVRTSTTNPTHNVHHGQCPAPRHNTTSAYYRYGCRCQQARQATSLYTKRRRTGHPETRRLPATPTTNRIQALHALGHTATTIAATIGWTPARIHNLTRRRYVTPQTATTINHAYQQLRNTPGTSHITATRATRAGYLTPTEWDTWGDINDPTPHNREPIIDEEAITRVLHHQAPIRILHPHEETELYDRLHNQGLTDGQIRHRLRLSASTTNRIARTWADQHRPERTPA